jgi:hypothetical protein
MFIVTQFQESITIDHPTLRQSQSFCSHANPFPTLRLSLRIIIVMGQMLVEVIFRCLPVLLGYAAKHNTSTVSKNKNAGCDESATTLRFNFG